MFEYSQRKNEHSPFKLGESRLALFARGRCVAGGQPGHVGPTEFADRYKHSRRLFSLVGITLVELLIAIAILAILTAIVVPSYSSYRERVRVQQAASDIVALGAIIKLYEIDNRTYPATLADIGKAGMLDPWNRPYEYLRLQPLDNTQSGKVRKDKNLVPINSDFDL